MCGGELRGPTDRIHPRDVFSRTSSEVGRLFLLLFRTSSSPLWVFLSGEIASAVLSLRRSEGRRGSTYIPQNNPSSLAARIKVTSSVEMWKSCDCDVFAAVSRKQQWLLIRAG